MKALILGENPGALAVVRELGRCGWTVGVGSGQPFGLASASRWCRRHHRVPRPLGDLQRFIDAVNAATREGGYDLVFGPNDAEVLALSAVRDRILPLVPYGPHDGVQRAFDKLSLSDLAVEFGIPTPRTLPANADSLDGLDTPLAVKPRLHWTPGRENHQTRVEAVLCSDKASARREAERMRALCADPLFQAYVPGKNMVLTLLADRQGDILSAMIQVEDYAGPWRPMANFRAVTIAVDRDLMKRCQALLKSVQWFGLACFQFQITEDGTPFLIDFNGRAVWDSALASACRMRGHDTWARLAIGAAAPRKETFLIPQGHRYQDLENDLKHTLRSMTDPRRALPEIGQFLGYAARSVHPVLAKDDIGPLLSYLTRLPRRMLREALHKGTAASSPRDT